MSSVLTGSAVRRAFSRVRMPLLLVLGCLMSFCFAPNAPAFSGDRVYEQVTPPAKNGGSVGGPVFEGEFASAFGQSAADGNSIVYVSQSSFGDAVSAEFFTSYISSRSGNGWSTHAISPPAAVPARFVELSPFRFFAEDLSVGLLEWGEPLLTQGAPPGFDNLYLRDAAGAYRALIDIVPPNLSPNAYEVTFAGATPGLRHVIFEANDALLPGAPAGVRSVYEWTGSTLRLVSVLPSGAAADGAGAGDGAGDNFADVVANDGSRVFWTDDVKQLYMRERGVRTVKLNVAQRVGPGTDGAATLLAIAPDGSKAIFTDDVPLTEAPDDHGGGIYEYDVESEGLRNLTPRTDGPGGVQGVLGMSDDASAVYFVSTAVLADGARRAETNLYVSRDGAIEFIAGLNGADGRDWTRNFELRTARVTPDGVHVAFISRENLTGYDNADPVTGELYPELFVYDDGEGRVVCVSCRSDGVSPIGGASIPTGTNSGHQPRILSDDGARVVFNSADALVAADTNGQQDIYEYEEGALRLVSTGRSSDISGLVDVSPGGRDIFFTSRERLVAADRDNGSDIYDARIGGGFPVPAQPLQCAGEACRGPLSVLPVLLPPATSLWGGDGNRLSRRSPNRCRPRGARSRPATARRCRKRKGRR